MKTIWKQVLELRTHQTIPLPVDLKILSVQVQASQICLWFYHDPSDTRKRQVQFMIVGTGQEAPEPDCTYLASVQQDGYVWHVFMKDSLCSSLNSYS